MTSLYNPDTELLFPSRVIPTLRDMRGPDWAGLVDRVAELDFTHADHLAFVFMMVKLSGCTSCHADSYRAMRGCTKCAEQTMRRFRGADEELLSKFEAARQQMEDYMKERAAVDG